MPVKAPVAYAPPAPNWNGFYIGVMGGYGSGDLRTDAFGRERIEGGFIGGTAGYNFQAPGSMWVFGIEGDGAAANIRTDNAGVGAGVGRLDAFGTVRGRVGVAFSNVLFYGTGGLAIGNIHNSFAGFSESQTHLGYAAGAGIEYAFSPNWSAKVEYMYMDFGRENHGAFGDARADVHTIKGGINYRFNWGGPVMASY
jgi:outer membrane immunogenic protein